MQQLAQLQSQLRPGQPLIIAAVPPGQASLPGQPLMVVSAGTQGAPQHGAVVAPVSLTLPVTQVVRQPVQSPATPVQAVRQPHTAPAGLAVPAARPGSAARAPVAIRNPAGPGEAASVSARPVSARPVTDPSDPMGMTPGGAPAGVGPQASCWVSVPFLVTLRPAMPP